MPKVMFHRSLNTQEPERAHFLLSSSFIELETVELKHVLSSNFTQVFQVFAQVIRVFQIFPSSSLAEFEF